MSQILTPNSGSGVMAPQLFNNQGAFQQSIAPMAAQSQSTFDAAIESGRAYLISELEKRDARVRQPLTSITYPRDIPMKVGGGWVEFVSSLAIDYGVTNGTGASTWHAPESNLIPVIQANLNRDVYKTHIFSIAMRVMFVDLQRSNYVGRSLDQMLRDGVRLSYDKHMDAHVYIGTEEYGTYGILNNTDVVAQNVAAGAAGTTTWATKTTNEILADINNAILSVWEASGWDRSALPNHILLPYEQYNYIATTRVSELAEKTILTFLMENNVSSQNGGGLFIGATAFNKGAGVGGSNRMVVYVNNDRFIQMEELVPLSRVMTGPNIAVVGYDSIYMANMSDPQFLYTQTIGYFDGI